MKRRKFILALLLTTAIISLQAQNDSWRILFLNTPEIVINGQTLHRGDTFQGPGNIRWSAPRQAMKVINLSTSKQRLVVSEQFTKAQARTLEEFLRGEKSLSTRQGVLTTLTEINDYLSDTFYLADSIIVATTLPTDSTRFFYASYLYQGECINKRLYTHRGEFVITPALYTIDGTAIPPFDITLKVYYYDTSKESATLLSDRMQIIPLPDCQEPISDSKSSQRGGKQLKSRGQKSKKNGHQ